MSELPFEKIKRKVIIKRESETSDEYGCKPEDRSTKDLIKYGVICVNKQQGPTSHQVSDYVKKILELKKCGHGGTLDPNVYGVLPVALEEATRVVQTLLPAGKEYVCLMHVHKDFEEKKLRKVIKEFMGKIDQLPPVRSAVKRELRQREIYYLDILEIKNKDVLFKVGCQAGTYIRKLCTDIGKKLKTGANMQELVRTKAGPFKDEEMYSLHDIKDAYTLYKEGKDKELRKIIKPMEYGVRHLPKVWITDTTVDSIAHGAELSIPGIAKFHSKIEKKDLVAIMSLKDELVAIGLAHKTSEELEKREKGLAVKLKKTFYPRKVYPKYTKK